MMKEKYNKKIASLDKKNTASPPAPLRRERGVVCKSTPIHQYRL